MASEYKPYVLGTIWTNKDGELCPSSLSLKFKHKSGFPVKTFLSFDILDNIDFYDTSSLFVAILITHCLADKLLFELLKLSLINKSLLKRLEENKITFYDKITLCNEKLIISEGTLKALKTFNALRNNIAHGYNDYSHLVKKIDFSSFEKDLEKIKQTNAEGTLHLHDYFDKLVPKEKILRKEKYVLLDFIQTIGIEGLENIFLNSEDKIFIEPVVGI